jgi:hypothetical protein
MKKEHRKLILYGLIILGTVWLWRGPSHTASAQKEATPESKETHMTLAAQTVSAPTLVPPIDIGVTDQFETASFGLG